MGSSKMRLTAVCRGSLKVAMDAYFSHLNGVFCIYKPTGFSTKKAVTILKNNVLKELNELPAYKHEIEKHEREKYSLPPVNQTTSPVPTSVPETTTDFSEHRLVLGDMFLTDDIKLHYLHGIGRHGSGIVVCSLGKEGSEDIDMIRMARFLRVYHVKGRFGYATDSFYPDGNFIERTTYRHVNKAKLDKVCGAAQSGHQSLMFQYAGVNPNSQEAYELASRGLIRPDDDQTPPILYGVKCIDFNLPDFTLELHAINEYNNYLAQLVNDIGLQLKTTAVCTHLHRLRYGVFTLEYALLLKQWHLQDIMRNIKKCRRLLTPKNLMTDVKLTPDGKRTDSTLLAGNYDNKLSADDILKQTAEQELSELREKLIEEQQTRSESGFSKSDDHSESVHYLKQNT